VTVEMPERKASFLLDSQRETSMALLPLDHVDEHPSLEIDKAGDIHRRVLGVCFQKRRLVDA
jgi:hypothetical protein